MIISRGKLKDSSDNYAPVPQSTTSHILISPGLNLGLCIEKPAELWHCFKQYTFPLNNEYGCITNRECCLVPLNISPNLTLFSCSMSWCRLGGVVGSVLATGRKDHGFESGQSDGR
jgi:hypothetical protein